MPKLINQAKIIILALALALGISYVSAAGTWAPPTAVPPGGMVDVPLNVGSNAQIKAGDLGVGAFLANLNSQFLGNVTIGTTTSPAQLRLVNGTQGAGKVLTSDANGNATWAAGTGGFSAPNYDSGWVSMSDAVASPVWGSAYEKTITHNLGTDETFVYIEAKNLAFGGSNAVSSTFLGLEDTSGNSQFGFTWRDKTSSTIKIMVGNNENKSTIQVRVRMWKI